LLWFFQKILNFQCSVSCGSAESIPRRRDRCISVPAESSTEIAPLNHGSIPRFNPFMQTIHLCITQSAFNSTNLPIKPMKSRTDLLSFGFDFQAISRPSIIRFESFLRCRLVKERAMHPATISTTLRSSVNTFSRHDLYLWVLIIVL